MKPLNLGGIGYLNIQAPSYAEQLTRLLGMKGDLPGELAARFDASLTLDNLREPEFWWLRRGRRFAHGQTAAGVAGQFTLCEARLSTALPVGTNLALIEHIAITNLDAAAQSFYLALRPLPGLLAFVATEFGHLDDRQAAFVVAAPVAERPILNISAGNNVAAGGVIPGQAYGVVIPPFSTTLLPLPYAITGRAVLRIASGGLNVAAGFAFSWRERELMEPEK